jgi:hypothetical protein
VPAVRILVLSPHFDDAPLSLGQSLLDGSLARHQVTVGVVFGRTNWTQWFYPTPGRAPLVSAIRCGEEAVAAARFGFRLRVGGRREAILRTGDLSPDAILDPTFDPTTSGELPAVVELARRWAAASEVVLAPAGLGHHVDHRLVTAAATQLAAGGARVGFYEDRPYACSMGDDEIGDAVRAVDAALVALPVSPPIGAEKHRRLWYPSQLDEFFHTAMRLDEELGRRERIWVPDAAAWASDLA